MEWFLIWHLGLVVRKLTRNCFSFCHSSNLNSLIIKILFWLTSFSISSVTCLPKICSQFYYRVALQVNLCSQLSNVRGFLFEVCFSLRLPFPMSSWVLESVKPHWYKWEYYVYQFASTMERIISLILYLKNDFIRVLDNISIPLETGWPRYYFYSTSSLWVFILLVWWCLIEKL